MPASDRVPGLCMMNELKTTEDYNSLQVLGSNHNAVIHEDRADRGATSSGKTKDSCESSDCMGDRKLLQGYRPESEGSLTCLYCIQPRAQEPHAMNMSSQRHCHCDRHIVVRNRCDAAICVFRVRRRHAAKRGMPLLAAARGGRVRRPMIHAC